MSISNGQYTLRKALSYLGSMEGPPNKSGSPIVSECQEMYGLNGVPWCACFVGYCVANSEASDQYKKDAASVVNPSTAEMVARAKRKGWYKAHGKYTAPGDLFIIDGLHVGFINALNKDGTFQTVEGNASNGVRSLTRSWSDGWQVISIPGVGAPGPQAVVDGYGFDDTRVKVYGGWPTPEARNGQMNKFAKANPDYWTQALRVQANSPFAFRAGPKGTYGHYTFGPWLHKTGKEIRDKEMQQWQDKHKGATARPWKKTYKEA